MQSLTFSSSRPPKTLVASTERYARRWLSKSLGVKVTYVIRYLFPTMLALPMLAFADYHRPEDWPEGSAMHTGRSAQVSLAAADKRLNEVYQKLLQSLPADEPDNFQKKTLKEAQRAWITFRDAEGGVRMWKSAFDTACQSHLTEERVKRLEGLLPSYEK
jgi:uncharacterized protein YecT (DUF1311 family)